MQSECLDVGNSTYRFDVGPSLLLLPDTYDKTFKALGAQSIHEYIDLIEVRAPQYRVYFEDDEASPFDITRDAKSMEKAFKSLETHGDENLFQRYQVRQRIESLI